MVDRTSKSFRVCVGVCESDRTPFTVRLVIHDQTQEFLVENKILYKYQSGFHGNHSTDSCLSYLNDKILQ